MVDALFVINLIIGIFTVWQSLISIYKFYRRRPIDTGRRNRETITLKKWERIDERTNIEQRRADFTVNIRNVDNRNDLNNENVLITIACNRLGVSIDHCHCLFILFTYFVKFCPFLITVLTEKLNNFKFINMT